MLIFIGVGVAGVAFTTLSELIIGQQALWSFERRRMRDTIKDLHGHTIICGYGRLSRIAAVELWSKRIP